MTEPYIVDLQALTEGRIQAMTSDAEPKASKAYHKRVGLVAEIPNFPGPWAEVVEKVKLADELGYHWEFFNLERGFKLRFTPLRADLPIYIAAMGPKNVEQSGEIADGVLPVYWPGNKWGEMRAALDEGARIAGRPAHSCAIAPYVTGIVLSENADENERAAARMYA